MKISVISSLGDIMNSAAIYILLYDFWYTFLWCICLRAELLGYRVCIVALVDAAKQLSKVPVVTETPTRNCSEGKIRLISLCISSLLDICPSNTYCLENIPYAFDQIFKNTLSSSFSFPLPHHEVVLQLCSPLLLKAKFIIVVLWISETKKLSKS